VIDTGIGMSQAAQNSLFQPFEQGDSSTSRRFGGTGLGLNITKQLVEVMDGRIGFESTLGEGSRFYFYVRLKPGKAERIKPKFNITPARVGEIVKDYQLKILLIEDNAVTRFLVSQVMTMWSHAVVAAENGKQGVEEAEGQTFDIILMDMQMPIMAGPEAVRLIRKGKGRCAKTPIIAFTADAIPENRAGYIAAGCDAVVTKPIEWDVLAKEIKYAMERVRDPQDLLAPLAGEYSDEQSGGYDEGERPPAATDTLPVLDRSAIDSLQQGVGPVIMRDLLSQCLESMDQYMADIRSSASQGQFEKARRAAHDLKSVCTQFGALKAGELARRVELALGDMDGSHPLIGDLAESVSLAAADIRERQAEFA